MAKGYAEGPAAEEAERRREELERGPEEPEAEARLAVYGSGEAWGLTVVRVTEP
jgi:hypothetical protein